MTDAFISYSRRDATEAEQVVEHLRTNRLEPWIDTHGIPPGDRWSDEVKRAIEEAGCVVVIVTPHALASREVAREVEHARQNGKPVIPLVVFLPDDATGGDTGGASGPIGFARLPVWLGEHQVIDARAAPRDPALEQLVSAVRRDHHWRRHHADLLARARSWNDGRGSLLSGRDLEDAREWLERVPHESARPTDLQRSFIKASAAAQEQRQREKADRLAELVLAGFYDPDLAIPLAAANVDVNAASDRAVVALDRALRRSRSLGNIGAPGEAVILRFLDDGQSLFIGYRDALILVVRAADGELRARWPPDPIPGRNIRAVSGSGLTIVEDGGVILRVDPFAPRSERFDYYLSFQLAAAAFDRAARWLLTANYHGQAWLWDMQQGRPTQELVPTDRFTGRIARSRGRPTPQIDERGRVRGDAPLGDQPITAALSDDARYAAVGRDFPVDGYSELTVHDTGNGRQVLTRRFDGAITSLRFRPGRHDLLVVSDGEGFVQPLPSGLPVRLAGGIRDIDGALTGSPDGRFAAAVGTKGFVRVFDLDTRDELWTLGGHDHLADVAPDFSRDGLLATGLVHGTPRLWNLRDDGEQRRLDVRECPSPASVVVRDSGLRPLVHVSVSPDGSRLCAAAQPLLAGIWPLERLADPAELSPTPAAEEGHLAWLADGSLVGIPYRERQSLYRFRARGRGYASELLVGRRPTSGENEFDFANTERDMAQGWYTRVAVSATGHRLALEVGGGQRSVEVWTPDPLNRLLSVEIDEGIRKATARERLLALSGDGTRLLLAHEDSGYLVWSVDTDARIEAPTLALGHCHLGAWAPQGSRFAVAHESSITVVNSDSTADPVELVGHAARVLSLAFCPRGERLVSGGQDGSLRVWNARTGAELRRLDVSSGCAVTAVCFTADGESVISGSTDSYVRIWRLWPLEELQVLAKQRGIVLSEESRRRFGLSA